MNTNDKNTKLTKMTNTIINCTEKDNYEDLIYEITMDTIPQFIQSFAGLLNTLSEPVINSIKECFITSIIAKEHRDMKHYENEHDSTPRIESINNPKKFSPLFINFVISILSNK